MLCKLCKKDKKLIKSHIIPDCLYKPLRGKENEFYNLNRNLNKSKKIHTGIFDENILCDDCDNKILGPLDNYGSSILLNKNLDKIKVSKKYYSNNEYPYYHFSGIDYKKFKLFLLSILWRSSISNQSFFDHIKLGPYEEKIREMILHNKINKTNELPCIIIEHQNPIYIKFPEKMRLIPHNELNYVFPLNNYRLYFFVTKNIQNHDINKVLKDIIINENGNMKIYKITTEESKKMIDKDFRLPISQISQFYE